MQNLEIPWHPRWYAPNILACASDNTLIFGSRENLVFVLSTPESLLPYTVKTIEKAHTKIVVAIDINKKWANPHKLVVSLAEDNIVNLWDADSYKIKLQLRNFEQSTDPLIGAVFAGHERVVMCTKSGTISIWNTVTGDLNTAQNVLSFTKSDVSSISACPHVGWIVAFGFYNGLVAVVDVRRDCKVLYKMKGHNKSVVSLSWCPAPTNVFPEKPFNTIKTKTKDDAKDKHDNGTEKDTDKTSHIEDIDCKDNESKFPIELKKGKIEQIKDNSVEDNVKEQILGTTLNEEVQSNKGEIFRVEQNESKNCDIDAFSLNTESNNQIVEDRTSETDPTKLLSSDDMEKREDDINQIEIKNESEQIDIVSPVSVEEEPRKEFLLASASKDGYIYIWRAGTDGRMQTFFPVQEKKVHSNKMESKSWISICWITPNILLSSCIGKIAYWPLPRTKSHKLIGTEKTILMNIVCAKGGIVNTNWRNSIRFWSYWQHGLITNQDLHTEEINCLLETVSSPATALQISPVDPNRIVIGEKEGYVRIWNLSLTYTKDKIFTNICVSKSSKISSICWHPLQENLIAFGNEDGRVGVINITTGKSKLMPYYFRQQIYKVEWGPMREDDTNFDNIFAVSEGKIIVYNTTAECKEPIILSQLSKSCYITKFTWKLDYSLLLVNTKQGELLLYSRNFEIFASLYFNDKFFANIVWHPESKYSDSKILHFCNTFAAITTTGFLIYDIESISDANKKYNLNTFNSNVVSLTWSCFESHKIAVATSQGVIHVWDVLTKSILNTISGSINSFTLIQWSPIDPDFLIGVDNFIKVWKLSEHEAIANEDLMETKIDIVVNKKKKLKKKTQKFQIVPAMCPADMDSNDITHLEHLILISKNENGVEFCSNCDGLQLFGSKKHVYNMLTHTENACKDSGKYRTSDLISLWKGDVNETVTQAIEKCRVTPLILTLASMISPKMWQNACYTYAKQLSEESDVDAVECATYFLACHKVEEAINYLCTTSHFTEALALAKCRLPDDSIIIHDVISQWAEHLISKGSFELAAKNYVSIRQYEKAAKILARRNCKPILDIAAKLASECNNEELLNSIRHKSMQFEETPNSNDDSNCGEFQLNLPNICDIIVETTQEVQENEVKIESEVNI